MAEKHAQTGRLDLTPGFQAALLSGGDERIAIDPLTGRNRYGVLAAGADHEVGFASSTASSISSVGRAAAIGVFERLLTGLSAEAWTQSIRDRILQHIGAPGAAVILTGSGTEAELILLALAGELLGRPITNVVTSPEETGSGVPLAAAGRHFLQSASCAAHVIRGDRLDGLERNILAEGVAIRHPDGDVLPAAAVDAAVADRIAVAIRSGRDAIVHCLDTSKTGLSGLSRTAAAALLADHPGRVLVAVDACQLRCSAETIRQDLLAGFFVLITGSKFLGGPPFSGALLVPPSAVARLRRFAVPQGLGAYSARHDWPAILRERLIRQPFSTGTNIGLGLRWEAALAEWDAFAAQPEGLRHIATAHLGTMIRRALSAVPGLRLLERGETPPQPWLPTIFPVITTAPDGGALCASTLHRELRSPARPGGKPIGRERVFHVGQPVSVGHAAALRIVLGASHITQVAARLAAGEALDVAAAPVAADLDDLIARWAMLRAVVPPLRLSA